MMRLIPLIILVFAFVQTRAQTSNYFAFPDSNVTWNVDFSSCCWSTCPGPPNPNPIILDESFSYFFSGDTLMIGEVYHKLYRSSGWAHEHCAFGGTSKWTSFPEMFMGGIRHDLATKRVYHSIPALNTECVLYDFDLNVGDTLFDGCSNWDPISIVAVVDSVLVGSSYRKQFHFQNSSHTVIEGIGSNAGLLEPMFPFEQSGYLDCYTLDGVTLYPDTLSSCILVTTIDDVTADTGLSAYPNPFKTTTTIALNEVFVGSTFIMYDALGNVVKQEMVSDQHFIVDREGLENGHYFFQIMKVGMQPRSGKLFVD